MEEKFTLQQFINLFNSNTLDITGYDLWDEVYIKVYDSNGNEIDFDHVQLVKRNNIEIK